MNSSKHAPARGPLEPDQYRDWCTGCGEYAVWLWPTMQRHAAQCTACGRTDDGKRPVR